jgi:2-methylcitrate dehydratase PrpD
MSNESMVARLGSYAAAMESGMLPAEAIERLKSCLLYNLSLGMATLERRNLTHQAIDAIYCASGTASLIGVHDGGGRSAADAACVNASLITARGQNDTHAGINGHLGCVVIPAVLALAEERGADAETVLAALAVGYEIPPRIAGSAVSGIVARGLRGTSMFAVFGAAAASARVIGLDARRIGHAIAIAANHCAGLVQCYAEGSMEWQLQVAEAARAGVVAALMAERGIVAADAVLEGPRGFYQAYGNATPELVLDGWTIPEVSFKPFPGCAINQPPAAVLIGLMQAEGIVQADVASVDVALHPAHASYPGIGKAGPFATEAAAIMSAPFMLSVALERGSIAAEDFAERYASDPVHAWSARVTVTADEALKPFDCRVVVRCHDGRFLTACSIGGRQLMFDWSQTVGICEGLSREWPVQNNPRAFDALRDAVLAIDCGNTMRFASHLMSATRPLHMSIHP